MPVYLSKKAIKYNTLKMAIYQPDTNPVPDPIVTMMFWDDAPDWEAKYWAWYHRWHGCRLRSSWVHRPSFWRTFGVFRWQVSPDDQAPIYRGHRPAIANVTFAKCMRYLKELQYNGFVELKEIPRPLRYDFLTYQFRKTAKVWNFTEYRAWYCKLMVRGIDYPVQWLTGLDVQIEQLTDELTKKNK